MKQGCFNVNRWRCVSNFAQNGNRHTLRKGPDSDFVCPVTEADLTEIKDNGERQEMMEMLGVSEVDRGVGIHMSQLWVHTDCALHLSLPKVEREETIVISGY